MIYSDWDERGEYTVSECDECGDSDTELFWDDDKMLCPTCLGKKYFNEMCDLFRDDIIREYAEAYSEGFDVVDQDY